MAGSEDFEAAGEKTVAGKQALGAAGGFGGKTGNPGAHVGLDRYMPGPQREAQASGEDGFEDASRIRGEEQDDGVGRGFLQCLEKGIGSGRIHAVRAGDDRDLPVGLGGAQTEDAGDGACLVRHNHPQLGFGVDPCDIGVGETSDALALGTTAAGFDGLAILGTGGGSGAEEDLGEMDRDRLERFHFVALEQVRVTEPAAGEAPAEQFSGGRSGGRFRWGRHDGLFVLGRGHGDKHGAVKAAERSRSGRETAGEFVAAFLPLAPIRLILGSGKPGSGVVPKGKEGIELGLGGAGFVPFQECFGKAQPVFGVVRGELDGAGEVKSGLGSTADARGPTGGFEEKQAEGAIRSGVVEGFVEASGGFEGIADFGDDLEGSEGFGTGEFTEVESEVVMDGGLGGMLGEAGSAGVDGQLSDLGAGGVGMLNGGPVERGAGEGERGGGLVGGAGEDGAGGLEGFGKAEVGDGRSGRWVLGEAPPEQEG